MKTVEVSQRVIGAPKDVFPYFTDPEKYVLWQGREAKLDPRPGGIYRVEFFDGGSVEGEYVVVEPPHRIVFSWGWVGPELTPQVHDLPPGSTTVEVTLVPDGDGTIINLRHTGLPTDLARAFHDFGWAHLYLPRLAVATSGGDAGEDPAQGMQDAYRRGELTLPLA